MYLELEIGGITSAVCERREREREREEREQEERGAGVFGPHCLRDLRAGSPIVLRSLIIFGGEDKRKEGGIDRKARAPSVVTGPSGLSGLKAEGKSSGGVDSSLGFPAIPAGLSQNSLSLFQGPCIATFQKCKGF